MLKDLRRDFPHLQINLLKDLNKIDYILNITKDRELVCTIPIEKSKWENPTEDLEESIVSTLSRYEE